ncbi:hypothetical protein CspeluHIS016_0502200 [Cutaneotrichosporon spelunceum]|uniref:F-box domain-containing protein n=1 Tax=Cutaneotrichosporon spelunceum TaxID=1672016 RepID=A0AAD3TWU1_9TREE|nr:hypothetical protein CspeluHIS016_0502200 [Cutaneotrichosporon spelunceum]
MDVDFADARSDSVDRHIVDSDVGSSQYNGKCAKRIRIPPVTKLIRWNDLPNWYSRKDTPLLTLPPELLDRIFSLETGLVVRDYVALAGVNRMFRRLFDDAVFKEVCLHHLSSDKSANPPPGVPVTSQIFSRDVPEWKVSKTTTRLHDIPSNTYTPRGKREDWSRAQYTVYRQERDIHLMKHRLARYKAGYEASVKRKETSGKPIEHPPVKDGTATRQVIGVLRGCRPGERPFGPKGEATDQQIARYDHSTYERRILGAHEWTKMKLDELEAKLNALIREAEHPHQEDDGEPRKPWSVPCTPESDDLSDDKLYSFEPSDWGEDGYRVIHDFWPSPYRDKAAASLYEKRLNKTTANDLYKLTDAELATLKHVLAANPLNKATPRRLFLETAVEALAYRVHGGPVGHAMYHAKMTERIKKGRETRRAKRGPNYDVVGGYRKPKHWKG